MVSVIIPIYNVERYLKQCLKSVLNQTYKDIEIILVNDASPDGSLTICKQFAERDSRIRIIDKQTNEGVAKARFSGIYASHGKYIYFVDSDDWLARNNEIEELVKIAEETGADYVMSNYQAVFGRSSLFKIKNKLRPTGLIGKDELRQKYYLNHFGWPIVSPTAWGKLYRKSTIIRANIEPHIQGIDEDTIFNLRLFPFLKSIYIIDKIGYNYRMAGGMFSKFYPNWIELQRNTYEARIAEAQKFNYSPGIRQSKANLLAHVEVSVITRLANESSQIVKTAIAKEMADPFWDAILRPDEYPEMFQTPFMQALAARDVDKMIELSLPAAKRQKRMARIKKIAKAILSRI